MFAFHVGCFNVLKESLQKQLLIFIYLLLCFGFIIIIILKKSSCFAFMREQRGRKRNSGGGSERRGCKNLLKCFPGEGNDEHSACRCMCAAEFFRVG